MTQTHPSSAIKAPRGSILITGGEGMLAWDIAQVFKRTFENTPVMALGRQTLNITSESSISAALEVHRPGWVFNCAAYTKVDAAEAERDEAEGINARGPGLLAKVCRSYGAKLIHFSTDQVFDGKSDVPRSETDSPSPSNFYAQTKLHGEQAVLSQSGSLVLRVQWLYGQRKDRFSPLRQKESFSPFVDQVGCPTWTRKVAETLIFLLAKDAEGLFHFSYDDYGSWADVFQFVKEQWKLPLLLDPKKTAEMNLPANRPLFSVLANEKLKTTLGVSSMGSWKVPLKEFLHIAGKGLGG